MRRAAPAASQHRGTPLGPGLAFCHDRKRKERITPSEDHGGDVSEWVHPLLPVLSLCVVWHYRLCADLD